MTVILRSWRWFASEHSAVEPDRHTIPPSNTQPTRYFNSAGAKLHERSPSLTVKNGDTLGVGRRNAISEHVNHRRIQTKPVFFTLQATPQMRKLPSLYRLNHPGSHEDHPPPTSPTPSLCVLYMYNLPCVDFEHDINMIPYLTEGIVLTQRV